MLGSRRLTTAVVVVVVAVVVVVVVVVVLPYALTFAFAPLPLSRCRKNVGSTGYQSWLSLHRTPTGLLWGNDASENSCPEKRSPAMTRWSRADSFALVYAMQGSLSQPGSPEDCIAALYRKKNCRYVQVISPDILPTQE